MERQQIRSPQSPLRCPYCHEGLALEEAWVACQSCLGRHHASCWTEGKSCSACGHGEHLSGGRPSEASSPAEALVGRERVYRIIDLDEQNDDRDLFDYVWSCATAGLVPLLDAEGRLHDHVRQHRGAQPELSLPDGSHLATRVRRYRAEAFDKVERGARRRAAWIAIAFALCVGTLLAAGIMTVSGASLAPLLAPWLIGGAGIGWLLTLFVGLAMHTRAVRGHELKQLYLEMIARGSEYDAAVAIREHRSFWVEIARQVGGVAIAGLVLPFLAPILLVYAIRIPLRAHLARELELEALRPNPVGQDRCNPN